MPVPPKAHLRPSTSPSATAWCGCASAQPGSAIPTVAYDDDPAYRRLNTGSRRGTRRPPRMTDNFLDITHFPFVHTGTFGGQDTEVPKIELAPLDDGFYGYAYEVDVNNDARGGSSGLATQVVTRRMTTGFHLPFTVRSTIHYETGPRHMILLLLDADRRRHLVLHVRRLAQRRPHRAGRGGARLRQGHRRGGPADARAGPGRPAPRSHGDGQRAGRPGVGRVAAPVRGPPRDRGGEPPVVLGRAFRAHRPEPGRVRRRRLLADLAAEAEDAGWDAFFLWDHILYRRDPVFPAVDPWVGRRRRSLSGWTSRLLLGPMVTPLARRAVRRGPPDDHAGPPVRRWLVFGAGLGSPPDAEFEASGRTMTPGAAATGWTRRRRAAGSGPASGSASTARTTRWST